MNQNLSIKKTLPSFLILIFISLLSFSCSESKSEEQSSYSAPIVVDNDADDELITDDDEATDDEGEPEARLLSDSEFVPKFILKTGSDYYLSDGTQTIFWQNGIIRNAGSLIYSVENQLIEFDSSGDQVSISELGHVPSAIKSTSGGVYYCFTYDPDTAYQMGGQRREYTEFYKDNVLIGDPWYYNAFSCESISSVGDNVFAKDEYGAYYIIEGQAGSAAYVKDDGFYTHDIDTDYNTIGFNGIIESFSFNYILGSKQWIKYELEYYSENGYVWSDSNGLQENQTSLQAFNSTPYPIEPANPYAESPVLLAAGQIEKNLYWIECNSGWLFEYDASTDALNQTWRVYQGDGIRSTGIAKRDSLKPMIFDNKLYFSNNGSVNRLDIETGFVDVFYAGVGEVMRYD